MQAALERYNKIKGNAPERLVSGSDDFTMFLWEPAVSKQPKTRMTGHQQVQFLYVSNCNLILQLLFGGSAILFIFTYPSLLFVVILLENIFFFLILTVELLAFYCHIFFKWVISLICVADWFFLSFKKFQLVTLTLWLQLVNHVYFSPDGQWVASASFDKSIKLWNGTTGKFVAVFRGHVGPVYQIRFELIYCFIYPSNFYCVVDMSCCMSLYSWSADSRLLLSGSKDSTLKVT